MNFLYFLLAIIFLYCCYEWYKSHKKNREDTDKLDSALRSTRGQESLWKEKQRQENALRQQLDEWDKEANRREKK